MSTSERLSIDNTVAPTTGGILHEARWYDVLTWLLLFGGERAFRNDILRLARVQAGDRVLDVGCGTGTLAIAAKRRVGRDGSIYGIDASPEMIARARIKARKRGLDVTFQNAVAEALPFPDAHFDVVLSTLMLHHLPRKVRVQAAREIRRVLKPQGRAVIVDFQDSGERHALLGHFRRHRHGHVKIDTMVPMLGEAGLTILESGPFSKRNIYFVIGTPGT